MKLLLKYILLVIMIITLAEASSARRGVMTFTQADGTKFEGILKGDSAFHWIESNAKVVLYNQKDKFYYYADVNENNELVLTNEKPIVKHIKISQQVSGVIGTQENLHYIDSDTKEVLKRIQQESRKGHRPR